MEECKKNLEREKETNKQREKEGTEEIKNEKYKKHRKDWHAYEFIF